MGDAPTMGSQCLECSGLYSRHAAWCSEAVTDAKHPQQEAFDALVPELLRAAARLRSEGRRFLPGCWQCGGDLNAEECVGCRKFFHFARDLRFTGGDAGLDTSIIDKVLREIGDG